MAKLKKQKIVAGNWKMNKTLLEALTLAQQIASKELPKDVISVLCIPSVFATEVGKIIAGKSNIKLGAQNCHHEASGAYTGETSVDMLHSVGIQYVIVGHSERREYQNESSEVLVKKINLLLAKGLTPIYCCGEPLSIRQTNRQNSAVAKQIKNDLFHLSAENMSKIVIAYEPIWAIGTGLTASAEQAQDMHNFIRRTIKKQYGNDISKYISILYGGSANAANAKTLFAQKDVDGGLIGGASLKADDFATIINSY